MTASQVELRAEWSVLPQQVDAVGQAVHVVIAETRRAPGCVNCVITTEMAELVTLRLVASWDSEDSLRRYVRSPRFEALSGVMESAITQPRIEFVLPGGRRGMDYAHDVRHRPGAPR